MLPGIGGGMAKGGMVEALYVGELAGIILIWAGYQLCIKSKAAAAITTPQPTAATPA